MTFNPFSLDYLYYPVSGIMWVWHKVFGAVLGANNAWAWVLSVIFLVFTLRAILFKPFMKQMESQLKMQAVQPQMKKLRAKYKDDKQRLTEEMMKLNKEAGVNPIGGCLPALIQAPVFITLFHVLRMFQPIPDGKGGFTFRDNVYFFGATDVHSFGFAKLFGGAPLSSSMTMPLAQLQHMAGDRATIIWVGVPLSILAGIATHLTSRRSVNRQLEINPEAAAGGQAAIMNKLMMWGFPLFVVVGGPFFPLAILFYWLANNSWTFGQLWAVHRLQDKRKAVTVTLDEEKKEALRFSKPAPGARPLPGMKPAVGAKPNLAKDNGAFGYLDTTANTDVDDDDDDDDVGAGETLPAGMTSDASRPGVKPAGARVSPGQRPKSTAGSRPQGNRNRPSSKKKKKR